MNGSAKRKLAAASAVALVLAGGALAAVSATGQGTSPVRQAARSGRAAHASHGPLSKAAGYLGLPIAQVRAELRSGKTLAQVADQTAGKSEAGLIEALVAARSARLAAVAANLPERVKAEVNAPVGSGGGARGPLGLAGGYLGLSASALRSQLRSGKTLALVADATPGKSEAGLVEALIAARTERLNAAVTAGAVSETVARKRLSKLPQRVHVFVNRRFEHRSR